MDVGDKVRRTHIYDGSKYAGRPIGPVLTVTAVGVHHPVDGPLGGDIAELSDGGWEFVWNLYLSGPGAYTVVMHYPDGEEEHVAHADSEGEAFAAAHDYLFAAGLHASRIVTVRAGREMLSDSGMIPLAFVVAYLAEGSEA